ncbi:DNRLRE domain-containing protein [Micromonospora sp. C51]|uniref:DNRLRE domain-containing protein n=1 Tax=Micromonospora sp. C51 TaxID=2824879 RepID=UPI001B38AE12|nr:DNRLRE domain-containing protein [Micromonospora sp. C51]MBQ1052072.1 DNRLRE domain-containing protein [Micromonospora sp. C51]
MRTARQWRAPRRFLITGAAALLTAPLAVIGTTTPAAAGVIRFERATSISYTDAKQPAVAFPVSTTDNVPIGTWKSDEVKHTSRAYFTFDLTPYRGKAVINAYGVTGESSVTDCEKPRKIEIWRTDTPAQPPTWNTAPQVHENADAVFDSPACPAGYLELDLTDIVRQAVADGQDSLTLMARIAGKKEKERRFSRWLKPLGISIEANAAPDVPSALTVAGLACADGRRIGTTRPVLSAEITDPDKAEGSSGDQVTATFAWWPVDRPTERTEWTSYPYYAPARFTHTVPEGGMVNGGTYAFSVRAADQHASSDWSPECRFTVDTVRPPAPTVTSTDYPSGWNPPGHGGPGIPGTFHFTAPGADDIAGYYYGENGLTSYVAADESGAATISHAPTRSPFGRLYVQAADRTGNRSTQTTYEFTVRDTAPRITDGNPDGAIGEPRELTFTPGMEDVVEYTYRLNDDEPVTVPAGADGTATATITPRKSGSNRITVTSRTSGGLPSGEGQLSFYLSTEPTVSSEQYPIGGAEGALVGTPGTFVFHPGMPGVTEYVWSVAGGPEQTVAAEADGTASVTFTSTFGGFHWMEVYSRTADGTLSGTASVYFEATSWAPTIESTDYPVYQESGGPGVAGEFTFRPARDGVTGYVYTFEGEEERTVTAGADGVATINWTPQSYPADRSGWVRLTVRATMGSMVSDETEHSFVLNRLAPTVTSSDYPPTGGGGPGVSGQFTLTAQMPGSTEFIYRYNGEEQTVAAGADGTATITLTPQYDGSHYLYVSSRTSSGITSGEDYYYFYVNYPG